MIYFDTCHTSFNCLTCLVEQKYPLYTCNCLQQCPVYAALADYSPGEAEPKGLPLVEKQLVEVMDMNDSEKWWCRDAANPTKQG